jgi:hypothetical protein
MRTLLRAALACAVCVSFAFPKILFGHGFEGDRFFPPTITTDDPFATTELNLPTVSIFEDPGQPKVEEVDASWEFDEEVFPKFALGASDTYIHLKPVGQQQIQGWDNLELSAKYQLFENAPHEFIFSIGLEADIGGTGTKSVADPFSTFTPTIYFGKGFGDLPDAMNFAKPFAVTGTLGLAVPSSTQGQESVQIGLAVEYNLMYLQEQVADIGLPSPLKEMIPVVEFTMQDPTDQGGEGQFTGTINPGVMWEQPDFQIGAEALIPMNSATGAHVGAVVSLQIYIDDIFPKIFGQPLFGKE